MAEDVDEDLALRLSALARSLEAESGPADTLCAITRASLDTIPGTDYAGVSLVRRRRKVQTMGATDPLVDRIDTAQYETGEGPCLDAAWEHGTFRVADLRDDDRWPRFGPRAVELGVLSILAFQLFVRDDTLGALNLYSKLPDAFTRDSEHVGLLLASHAAIALSGAQQVENLNIGLRNRDVIGQAKGLLMREHTLTGDQAFQLLVRHSQSTQTPLDKVAAALVAGAERRANRRIQASPR